MAAELADAYDLIVLGSGAAGMAAAITAASGGLSVLVVESSPYVGGTTAWSAGSVWIPNSRHSRAGADSADQALRYLDATVGAHSSERLKRAFLMRGRDAVDCLHQAGVEFRAYPYLPDYMSDRDGATLSGRALETVPFDGRLLGEALRLVRLPLPEFTVLNGMMVDRTDIRHLLNAHRSLASLRHALTIVLRHLTDRLRYGRGTRLVMGNALAARMLWAARRLGVLILPDTKVTSLLREGERVAGVAIGGRAIIARRGVVLATGGFSRHATLREKLMPEPVAQYSAVPESNRGEGIDLGLASGGHIGPKQSNPAFWAPASVKRRADGSTAVFPHFVLDRGKPGLIAVDRTGRRFVNEAISYQQFVEAIYEAPADRIPSFFICDSRFIHKYGLGIVRPRASNLKRCTDEGYVVAAGTPEELATRLGLDPAALADSIARNDTYAESGTDADFGKGTTAYQRNLGDPVHGPNPCIGRLERPPFYALRIYPADIGTSTGLETDEYARVLGADGTPISGLYAAGNDMHSVLGGVYPGPGATLGPAVTFGYVAATHAISAGKPG